MIPAVSQLRRLVTLLLSSVILWCQLQAGTSDGQGVTIDGCPDKCGNIEIPFPFGMRTPGSSCFLASGADEVFSDRSWPPDFSKLGMLQVTAHFYYSTVEADMPSRFINYTAAAVELVDVSVPEGTARVYAAISRDCSRNETYHELWQQSIKIPPDAPFLFSAKHNELVGVGRSVIPVLSGSVKGQDYQARCQSFLSSASSATKR